MICLIMDTIDFKNEFINDSKLSYKKCSECGDYKEVSKKYINKISDEVITICYDCGKKRYIESLMVVSLVEGIADFEA